MLENSWYKKENPFIGLTGMGGGVGSNLVGGGGGGLYVDDVFSTFLYEGNAGSQSINNGIDLDGEGGLVWIKCRNASERHSLQDTERGVNLLLDSSDTIAQSSITSVNAFNSNGFSLNSSNGIFNDAGYDYASWTFRKAPGFFDVVTYTGTGSAQTLSHSLGSVPGMMIVKNYTIASNWETYHRSTGATKKFELNENVTASANSGTWDDTEPTASEFTVGANNSGVDGNGNGYSYVAYIFAHDDQSFGDESIIKCGSYVGTSATQTIDCGFEPQWVMIKQASRAGGVTAGNGDWVIVDKDRLDDVFKANTTDQEAGNGSITNSFFQSNGFQVTSNNDSVNDNYGPATYIYVAIAE